MTELTHQQLPAQLKKANVPLPAVVLLHGEPTLIDQCLYPLTGLLLDGASAVMNSESIDGLPENIPDLLARINTLSFIAGPKVLIFKDAKLSDPRGDYQRLVDQVTQELEAEREEAAAKAVFSLGRTLGLAADDLLAGARIHPDLQVVCDAVGEDALRRLIGLGLEKGWTIDAAGDPVAVLIEGLEKGFPKQHHLVITSSAKVPKNRKLYKAIAAHGWIVDCSVPLGERKADKTAQEAVLRQTLERMLADAGKKMVPALFPRLTQLTGFDLPVFIQNIEKLIAFVGDRGEIAARDIDLLLQRTRVDPIFELTNAVADRHAARALSCLHGLLTAGWHPLQILAALAGQIRKLIVAKDFTSSEMGRVWVRAMPYPQFQDRVLPAVKAFDDQVADHIAAWEEPGAQVGEDSAPKKKATSKNTFDLALAPNPQNAYPIYQTLVKSDNYTIAELVTALVRLNDADIRLKSTGQDPAAMLTSLIASICRSGRFRSELN